MPFQQKQNNSNSNANTFNVYLIWHIGATDLLITHCECAIFNAGKKPLNDFGKHSNERIYCIGKSIYIGITITHNCGCYHYDMMMTFENFKLIQNGQIRFE